jgi:hypothetical protein
VPALPAVAGLIKLLLTFAAPGVAAVINRWFFQGSGTSNSAALNTACTTMANSWHTLMGGNQVPAISLIGAEAEDLTSPTSPTGIWVGSQAGSNAGAASTPALAFIVKPVTADRYRGGHSRIYIPGVSTGAVSASDATTWNTTTGAAIATAVTAFLQNCVTALQSAGYAGVSPVVPHFYKGGGRNWTHYGTAPNDYWKSTAIPAKAPIAIDQYSTVSYNDILGNQRRRNHQSS